MEERTTVLVLGSLTLDDVVRPDGTTAMAQLGGAGPYAAAGAALTGVRARLWAWAGSDEAGSVASALRRRGLPTDALVVRDARQPRAWQLFEADDTRTEVFRTSWGQLRDLYPSADEIPTAPPPDAAYLFAPHPGPYARAARAAGARTVTWEPPDDLRGPGDAAAVLGELEDVDAVTPNAGEWGSLLGTDEPEEIASIALARGPRLVAVRMGAEGAYLATREHRVRLPAAQVGTVVDTTGAGNAFSGALAAQLPHLGPGRADLERLGACAMVAAAMTIEVQGVPTTDPTTTREHRERVEAYLATRGVR